MENGKRQLIKNIVLTVIILIIVISLFVKLDRLKEQNAALSNKLANYGNTVSRLSAEIGSLNAKLGDAEAQLKKEASLLTGASLSVLSIDSETSTAKVKIAAIPKTVSEGMALTVSVGDMTSELLKNGSEFSGIFDISIFEYYDAPPLLTVSTGSESKTEYLEDIDISAMYLRLLPVICTSMSGTISRSERKLEFDIDISVDLKFSYGENKVEFVAFSILEVKNSKETGRKDITDEISGEYYNAYFSEYKKSFDIGEEDVFELFVIAHDSAGFIHAIRIYGSDMSDSQGGITSIREGDTFIYDKNGKLVME